MNLKPAQKTNRRRFGTWAAGLSMVAALSLVGTVGAEPKEDEDAEEEVDPNQPAPVKREPKFKPSSLR